MKKTSLLLLAIISLFQLVNAQPGVTQTTQPENDNTGLSADPLQIIDVYERIHIPRKQPIPYTYIREADVMWAKDIWRIIDLRERMNHSLFFPIQPIGNRMSLISLILHGISEYNLHAFRDDKYRLFSNETMIGLNEIFISLEADTLFPGTPDERINLKTEDVKKILVKEKWFFDKQHSTMQVRIVGIAPLKVYNRRIVDVNGNVTISPEVSTEILFWIYFPEYRELFARYDSYNPQNDAQNISFDDLFIQRRFSSYIFGESNVFDNRFIPDYMTGDDILLEAERIKQSIFEFEHDLWEY